MEHSVQYYRDFLKVLELAIAQREHNFYYEEGVQLSPDYWMAIVAYLKDNGFANANISRGSIYIYNFHTLVPLCADCRAKILDFEQKEKDRNLCNQHRLEGIIQGRKSYRLAKIAIWISAIVAVHQIVQWILMIFL